MGEQFYRHPTLVFVGLGRVQKAPPSSFQRITARQRIRAMLHVSSEVARITRKKIPFTHTLRRLRFNPAFIFHPNNRRQLRRQALRPLKRRYCRLRKRALHRHLLRGVPAKRHALRARLRKIRVKRTRVSRLRFCAAAFLRESALRMRRQTTPQRRRRVRPVWPHALSASRRRGLQAIFGARRRPKNKVRGRRLRGRRSTRARPFADYSRHLKQRFAR